ncbi:MAG: hypothetical protein JW808_11865 [Victivallales bacterium]|nr:hypothetical protein [Victivallales bacterium]
MKKGIVLIVVGVVVMVLGFGAPLLFLFPLLMGGGDDQFIVPGSKEIVIEKGGTYYLWHDYKTVFDNRTFSNDESIPDNVRVEMIDLSDNSVLDLTPYTSMSSKSPSAAKRTIGYYTLKEGRYDLRVDGDCSPMVFSLDSGVGGTLAMVFIGIGVAFVMMIISFALTVAGIVFLVKSFVSGEISPTGQAASQAS